MHFFETFVVFPTLEGWNYFLAEIWYWFVVAGVYGGIILSGLYRAINTKNAMRFPLAPKYVTRARIKKFLQIKKKNVKK